MLGTILCSASTTVRHCWSLRKAALASLGFCMKTALNGYDAMKMLEQSSVDAIVLEYKQEGRDSEGIAYQIILAARFLTCSESRPVFRKGNRICLHQFQRSLLSWLPCLCWSYCCERQH
jgi:hypothetical protein